MHENCWSHNGLHFGMIILNDLFNKFETKWKKNMELYRQMEDGIKTESKDKGLKTSFLNNFIFIYKIYNFFTTKLT